ncbi:flippase [Marinobacter sp. chi1]|uniref:Flippase n=1 Tax=Marinobacter suaedae TaxID=3057675 RepID=A0ABT8VWJ9_9GAMM|nr:flippase [Marinobacter sp. chi1]MDO3720308.1 flippase [Marinobacter sp. chi1]
MSTLIAFKLEEHQSLKVRDLYQKIKHYLHNTLWIMGDKVATLVVGFLVTVLVARYLGPEDFGLYSYVISVAAILSAAGHVGLSGLVVREIVKKPNNRGETLGTTLGLKFMGVGAGYVVLLVYAALYEGISSPEFVMLAIAGAALLFSPFQVFDFWFQAFVQAKYVTYARLMALAASAGLKIAFVFIGSGVIYFAGANLAQAVIVVLASLFFYKATSILPLSEWSFSWGRARELLSQGWLIYLGSIFAVVYLKVDQVMLKWFEGSGSVGIYAVAAQISEAWYFVPVAIVTSFFPKLIKLRDQSSPEFDKRFQQLLDLLFGLALAVALAMTLAAEYVILLFFGEHYIESASVLLIHVWAALFIFMRAALSKWILIENILVFSLLTQGGGALVNILLNYFLIPEFGVVGAAYATLLSYAFASFVSLALYSKTRPIFFMMTKSFFFVFRYLKLREN